MCIRWVAAFILLVWGRAVAGCRAGREHRPRLERFRDAAAGDRGGYGFIEFRGGGAVRTVAGGRRPARLEMGGLGPAQPGAAAVDHAGAVRQPRGERRGRVRRGDQQRRHPGRADPSGRLASRRVHHRGDGRRSHLGQLAGDVRAGEDHGRAAAGDAIGRTVAAYRRVRGRGLRTDPAAGGTEGLRRRKARRVHGPLEGVPGGSGEAGAEGGFTRGRDRTVPQPASRTSGSGWRTSCRSGNHSATPTGRRW